MKIFHYHPDTGFLVGEGVADKSPLERGVWLIPACATTQVPPDIEPGHYCFYNGRTWETAPIPEPEPEPAPEPEPEPAPEIPLPPTQITPDLLSLTTEEKLLRYGFTVDELKDLLGLLTT